MLLLILQPLLLLRHKFVPPPLTPPCLTRLPPPHLQAIRKYVLARVLAHGLVWDASIANGVGMADATEQQRKQKQQMRISRISYTKSTNVQARL